MSSGIKSLTSSSDQTLEHFRAHGWMRVPEAFNSAEAAAMRDVVWGGLEEVGIQRDAPTTWTIERPVKLQKLKDHPAFNAVGSVRLLETIGAVLETQAYQKPKRWGAIFLAFPTKDDWGVPASGWHVDANYTRASFGPRRAYRPTPCSATSHRAAAPPRSCRVRIG